MNEFKRYPSIENHYREKFITMIRDFHSEIDDLCYVVTEKLHGANIQIYFEKGKEFKYGKRSSFINPDEKFFDIHNTINKYRGLLDDIQFHIDTSSDIESVRLFGEYIAPGINKGVNYGKEHQLFFFDVYINGDLQNQASFSKFCADFNIPQVPFLGKFDSLKEAMDFDVVKNSTIIETEEENIMEGVVIKPYYRVLRTFQGSVFYLKKKNEKFLEESRKPKHIKTPVELTEDDILVNQFNAEFKTYLTDNRLQNVFSKHGEITEPNQIGDYLKLFIADAREDFLKDHELPGFDKTQLRKLFNAGSIPFGLIKKYL